jgi:hypothetical protein
VKPSTVFVFGIPAHDRSVLRLFYGKIRQRLAAVSQDSKSRSSVHEKEDPFSHLPVNVAEDGFDLYDGLSGYFDDVVDFEGKKARMEVSLVDLPPLLQVQLQVMIVSHFSKASLIVVPRGFNSTAKLCSHTSHKHMSNLERKSTWIVS